MIKNKLKIQKITIFIVVLVCGILFIGNSLVFAQATKNTEGFALLVSPSPIVETFKPGRSYTKEIKILNQSKITDTFTIKPRAFSVSGKKGDIKLDDTTPPDISNWISFSEPTFTIKSGQWYTQYITFNIPKDAGFSYSFALQISRANEPTPKISESGMHGSLAIFTLINIDRPGAYRKMELESFKSEVNVYEYLPAKFEVVLKNSGNTIAQPYGNIFIQRTNKTNSKPLATLPVNGTHSYIIPGTTRTLQSEWGDGFPAYITKKPINNSPEKTNLVWDWSKLNNIRFGKYYAKLVAAYNDGYRDVPIEGTLTFWVIPWKFILFSLIIIAILAAGFIAFVKKGVVIAKRATKRVTKKSQKHSE